MNTNGTPQRLSWTHNPLYLELTAMFPEVRTAQQKVLDIDALSAKLGMTGEGLYKWLREGRIKSSKGLRKIVDAANSPENLAALDRAGRAPPVADDLLRFLA